MILENVFTIMRAASGSKYKHILWSQQGNGNISIPGNQTERLLSLDSLAEDSEIGASGSLKTEAEMNGR